MMAHQLSPRKNSTRSRSVPVWLAMVTVCVAVTSGLIASRIASGAQGKLWNGNRPPEFLFADLNGRWHSLEDYENRILVLHFWATWCPYCRREVPKLIQIHEQLGAQGVVVLAVSVDQDLSFLKRFVKDQQLPYAVIGDTKITAPMASEYEVRGIPVTFIISRDGLIADRLDGMSDIVGAVERVLAESTGRDS